MRLGLRPTPSIVSSLPVRAAAATKKAADEGSPGTVPAKPSCWKRSTRTVEPSTSTGPPSARIARSVWSRVAAGSVTEVTPSASRPASSTALFT